jgi:hypothetical protein
MPAAIRTPSHANHWAPPPHTHYQYGRVLNKLEPSGAPGATFVDRSFKRGCTGADEQPEMHTLDTLPPLLSDSHLAVTFGPTMPLVTIVRKFVSEFYTRALGESSSELIGMATHELLENVFKYSNGNRGTLEIDVRPISGRNQVVVRVYNRAEAHHVAPLRQIIAQLNASNDPAGTYVALMRESAKQRVGSGLGLARLRAEAGMVLKLEIDDDRVSIIATCELEQEPASG